MSEDVFGKVMEVEVIKNIKTGLFKGGFKNLAATITISVTVSDTSGDQY